MSQRLPIFTYHPDPIGTGSVVESEQVCECCGSARGYKYNGSPHCDAEVEIICPWCIADGSAHEKFGAEFTDRQGIGDHGRWGQVSDAISDVVAHRTPGFSGWQQERWWVCCADAAAFVGAAGKEELVKLGDDAVESIRSESGFDADEWRVYFEALDKDHGPTAYMFRCHHCGKLGGYSDCH
ncbi:MAG TPA: CbrC family protein [Kofleriaceae bacterium]|nr:CbrC family protein [Kofleriaceae bacterium]